MTLKRPKSKLCMTACHMIAAQPQQPYRLRADITQQSQLPGAPLLALYRAQTAGFTLSAPPASDDLRERLAFRRSIELLVRSACSSGCSPPARCVGLRQVTLPNQVDRVGCFYETPTCRQILGRSLQGCCRLAAPDVFTALRSGVLCAAGACCSNRVDWTECRNLGTERAQCDIMSDGTVLQTAFRVWPLHRLHTLQSATVGCLQGSRHALHPPHISIAPGKSRGLLLAVPQLFRPSAAPWQSTSFRDNTHKHCPWLFFSPQSTTLQQDRGGEG